MALRFHHDRAPSQPDAAQDWVWSQHWRDVLFLHWAVPVEVLQSQLPAPLEVDTHDGQAWVSLVAFRLRVRPRWLPFLPGLSNLVELNLRAYVRLHGEPGIAFLSVHADNAWAMRVARTLTPMPYARAPLRYGRRENQFHFQSPCRSPVNLSIVFAPRGPGVAAAADTLDAWLLERYRLYAPDRRGGLQQAEVAHPPWTVQEVDVRVLGNGAGDRFAFDLSQAPDLAHFSPGVAARFGAFQEVFPARPRYAPEPFTGK